jgi:integrase
MNTAPAPIAQLSHTHVDLTFWINRAKANAAGKVPVSLRITVHGTRAEVSTKIRCVPERWDKATKRLRPDGKRDKATQDLNDMLDLLESKARLLQYTLKPLAGAPSITAAQVRAALLPDAPAAEPDALLLLEKALLTYGNLFTRQTAITALKAFRRFLLPATTLPLSQLTSSLAQDFAAQPKCPHGYTVTLRALYTKAKFGGENPFKTADKKAKPAIARPRYVLSKEELAALAKLRLPVGRDAVSRDIYMAQYYLHGSRIGVVLELTWAQVDWEKCRVHFRAEKGGGWHDVALRPALAAVLQRYYKPGAVGFVFPMLPDNYASQSPEERHRLRRKANSKVGHGLLAAANRLGLPGRLHPHTARHSLATHTVQATGSFRTAQEFLGHSSLSMTEKYVRSMLPTELDSAADAVYGS